MKKTIEIQYDIGDVVYLKTDTEQYERIVVGITIRPIGIVYQLAYEDDESSHYEIEMSDTKDVLKTMYA